EVQRVGGFGAAGVVSPLLVAVIGMAVGTVFLGRLYRARPLAGPLFHLRVGGFGAAVVVSPLLVAVIGMAVETVFLRRLYRGDPLLGLLFTFGLAMVGEQTVRIVWGASGQAFSIPPAL